MLNTDKGYIFQILRNAIDTESEFDEKQMDILKMRFAQDATYEVIARKHDMTREGVRSLLMGKLRTINNIVSNNAQAQNDLVLAKKKIRYLESRMHGYTKAINAVYRISAQSAQMPLERVSVNSIDISVRALNVLRAMEIEYLDELTAYSVNDLLGARNMGKKSLTEIIEVLEQNGLFLSEN